MKKIYKRSIPIRAAYPMLFILLTIFSCKKLIEVPAPPSSITSTNVYSTDASAIGVLTGLYTQMSGSGGGGSLGVTGPGSISIYAGLSADELTLYSGVSSTESPYYFYTNSLFSNKANTSDPGLWSTFYNYIFTCNAAIEGLKSSTSLTPAVKQQLLGEATFMRAFFYFYLVNLYGNIPLLTSTDYKSNELLANASAVNVYQQVIADLKTAQGFLSNNFEDVSLLNSTSERVRPNHWAATALLARAYLYFGNLTNDANQYTNAELQATNIINNSSLFALDSLNNVFLKNSTEAIWQLQPISAFHNTEDAWVFIIPSTGPADGSYPVYLSPELLNSFDAGDHRRVSWVDSVTAGGTKYFYPYKYKSATLNAPLTEYLMVLRLGEQYLIRAQARGNLGEETAINDLNIIRNRASLPNYAGVTDKTSLLKAIMHERQVELFTEWGHRWLDLKRTSKIDAVMGVPGNVCQAKGGKWSSYKQLYPIPYQSIQYDPNLKQNFGY